MRMRSVMSHAFSMVPRAEIPRSSFDRSHGHKTAFDAGWLVPIFVDEALPGDTFNLSMTGFARLSTPIFPVMDNMFMDTFFFAVPYRLLWENWERFNGARDNPDDSTDFLIPQAVTSSPTGFEPLSVMDYMGIPTQVPNLSVSSLPIRAYYLIWNEWFRDQNLQDSVAVPKGDGPDNYSGFTMMPRGKRHDYFTSALPWPQKGDSVELPLGNAAPVVPGTGGAFPGVPTFVPNLGGDNTARSLMGVTGATNPNAQFSTPGMGVTDNMRWSDPQLQVDLSTATSATINALRQAFQVQRLLERDARGGTRYTEVIRAHFGVISPDQRLQRPEYLGGGSTPVNVVAVAQTSASGEASTPQGNLSAFGTATLHNHGFTKSFTEHCVVIGLVNVRADLTYQQGLNRMWSRQTRFDFYWPALSHIGEQAILNKEIFAQGTVVDDDVFGYQERYAEYRYKPSVVTGPMRSNYTGTLDPWHLALDFASLPTLGATFIADQPPIDRVVAVPSEPHFIFDSHFRFRCARPMPLFGVPGMIDHF